MKRNPKLKYEKIQWCKDLYEQGTPVRQICEAVGITTPTFYRYLKALDEHLQPRKPNALKPLDADINPHRSKSARISWEKRRNAVRKDIDGVPTARPLSALEVLTKIGLSLGFDAMGHYFTREDSTEKVYLTEREFDAFCRKPIDTLKLMANRINTGLGGK